MADISWIKLSTNLFDNKKIRLIEKMPEGETIIVIWIKLLCLAGSTNDSGLVYFTKEIPFTIEMMSTLFDRPINIIRLALETFKQFEMIEVIDDIIHISSWEKYQNIEGMEKVREQGRIRYKRWYDKQKEVKENTSNVRLTLTNATDKDKEEEKEVIDIVSESDTAPDLTVGEVITLYNTVCTSLPKVQAITDKRRKQVKAVLKSHSFDEVKNVYESAQSSDFLSGRNGRWTSCNFDWLMNLNNFQKVLEGSYQNKTGAGSKDIFQSHVCTREQAMRDAEVGF